MIIPLLIPLPHWRRGQGEGEIDVRANASPISTALLRTSRIISWGHARDHPPPALDEPIYGSIMPTERCSARHAGQRRGDCRMGVRQKYSIIDPATGKIDRRIFSDQAVYDAEMEKIFGRAWLMIGHESLVPNVNDFFHTYMGKD